MLRIDHNSPVPLRAQVEQLLRDLVLKPEYQKGALLPDEVALARRMIAAFDMPENSDKGVVQIDGRMVERMHAEMARRTVAIAEAIAARAGN